MTAASGDAPPSNLLYNWDFTKSATDTIAGKTATHNGTIGDDGISITAANKYILLSNLYYRDRTIWIHFTTFNARKGGENSNNGRVIMAAKRINTTSDGYGFAYRNNGTIAFYTGSWNAGGQSATGKYNYFANSALKMYVDESGIAYVYRDSDLFLTSRVAIPESMNGQHYVIGGSTSDCVADVAVTGIQIYDGFVI